MSRLEFFAPSYVTAKAEALGDDCIVEYLSTFNRLGYYSSRMETRLRQVRVFATVRCYAKDQIVRLIFQVRRNLRGAMIVQKDGKFDSGIVQITYERQNPSFLCRFLQQSYICLLYTSPSPRDS